MMANNNNTYEYPIDECDVQDKDKLANYRSLRLEWLNNIDGDDVHGIGKQISLLAKDYTLYLVTNEMRRIAIEEPIDGVMISADIGGLLDRGFVYSQSSIIRRLIEPQSKIRSREVISLRSLIDSINENKNFITREIYVSYDGLPYDWRQVQTDEDKRRFRENDDVSGVWVDAKGPNAWRPSQLMHLCFD